MTETILLDADGAMFGDVDVHQKKRLTLGIGGQEKMETEYIEKQEAIKAICDSCGVMPDGEKDTCPYKYEGAGCREYDKIIDIPPADVRPVVRGRWIDYDDDYGAYICSKCEENAPEDIQWNFCPNCGADMREDNNGKET